MEEAIYTATELKKAYKNSNFKLSIPEINLKPNTITGIVGENGNGKTTLLNIIAGKLKAQSNSFKYFGEVPESSSDWIAIQDKIAFIPQRIPKWFGSLRQNLLLKAALENIPKEEIDTELNKIITFLGLKKHEHLKWSEISTGYRLRFELARILIGRPQLLVLDEPIANLDINAQQQFLADLKTIITSKNYPIAIILSSQQLHEIETVADEMIFIKQGEAIFSGNLEHLQSEENTIELLVKNKEELELFLTSISCGFIKKGVYHQINIGNTSSNDFLHALITKNIEINYYRNISNSTKKLF